MRTYIRVIAIVLGTVLLLALGASAAWACECGSSCDCGCGCGYWTNRSPGYWKNHPEAWPVESITFGGVTYTKAEAIALLGDTGTDKSITLFRQAVAAKLNILSGGWDDWYVVFADQWLTLHPVGSDVAGSSWEWQNGGECIYDDLVVYNGD